MHWVIDTFRLEIAIASPSFASLFWWLCFATPLLNQVAFDFCFCCFLVLYLLVLLLFEIFWWLCFATPLLNQVAFDFCFCCFLVLYLLVLLLFEIFWWLCFATPLLNQVAAQGPRAARRLCRFQTNRFTLSCVQCVRSMCAMCSINVNNQFALH